MQALEKVKLVLELVVLSAFVLLLLHIVRRDGRHAALSLLTNLP